MKISNSELKAILAEVEAELEPLLRSERERLSKAVGDEMSASAGSPMGEEASKSPGRDMLPEERSGGEASSASGSPMGSPAPGSADGAAPEGDPEAGQEGGGEVEALASEYAKLPPEELEMHLMALQAAMQQMGGGAEGSAGSPAGSPPPAGMEASAGSPAMKKEMSASASPEASKAKKAEKSPEKSMTEKSYGKKEKSAKEESSKEESEKSSRMSKSEFDALNTKVDMALKAVEFLTRPMRKAVTEFGETPAKVWSRGEVTTKLKEVTASPALAKSDRELINGFYDGRVSLDKIAHLLK